MGPLGRYTGSSFCDAETFSNKKAPTGLAQWTEAVEAGSRAISELGGAKPGDRTMVDALDPFVKALRRASANASREALLTAVDEAQKGADATAQMKPRLGRSSYLGSRVLGHPDPGAAAVAIWLRAVCEALFAAEVTIRQAPPGVKVSH